MLLRKNRKVLGSVLLREGFRSVITRSYNINISKKLDLFFIRHAESTNNVLNDEIKNQENMEEELLIRREADCGVSRRGMNQLKMLNTFVKCGGWNEMLKNRPTSYYCSPMLRCLQTAKALKCERSDNEKEIFVKNDLYEVGGCYAMSEGVNIGQSGSTSAEIESQFNGFTCLPGMENGWYGKPEKETKMEFNSRVKGVAEWLWEQVELTNVDSSSDEEQSGKNQIVLIVHGHFITTLMNYLLLNEPRACIFVHNNTGITHIQLTIMNNSRVGAVQFCNRIDHLLQSRNEVFGNNTIIDDDDTGGHLKSGNELVKDRWAKIFS